MFEDLDELASALAENNLSRRQAMKWAGYSVLGAALSSMGFAESAEALTRRGRRKCISSGGMVCGNGPLRKKYCCASGTTCAGGKTCAPRCAGGGSCDATFSACGDPLFSCGCTATVEGGSSCVSLFQACNQAICVTSQDCPTGWVCAATCCDPGALPRCNPPCPAGLAARTSEASSARDGQLSGVR